MWVDRADSPSLCVVEFPFPTVARKLETDSGVRIGLPVLEAAYELLIWFTALRLTELWLRELLG